jgi:hypothetical protein
MAAKFKKGDVIHVYRKPTTKEENIWGNSWVEGMNSAIGKNLVITGVFNAIGRKHTINYKLKGYWQGFPEVSLKKIVKCRQLHFMFK